MTKAAQVRQRVGQNLGIGGACLGLLHLCSCGPVVAHRTNPTRLQNG